MATTDPLTGLNNRRHFFEIFEKEIRRHKRERKPISFLMLDIDNFKLYNDLNGHPEGDMVLKEVTKVLHSVCRRSSDEVFRLGGEEFGVLILDTDSEKIDAFAQHIIDEIAALKLFHQGNMPYKIVTASLGGIVAELQGKEIVLAKDLYAKADKAMYRAKSEGKNRINIVHL